MVTYHHILTRKAYPEFKDEAWNKMPLCFKCHELVHKKGLDHLSNHNQVKYWLESNHWYKCDFTGKWRNTFQNKDS